MADELKSQSGGEKTPEQELAELLRQSQPKPLFKRPVLGSSVKQTIASPAVSAGAGAIASRLPKINWLALAIGALTLVLVFGTGYFLLSSLKFNTGEITLDVNEGGITLAVDGKEVAGAIDSGYVLRVKTGSHQLVLRKDGFLELSRTIEIQRGDKQLVVLQLLPIPSIDSVLSSGDVKFARLNQDGSEISYFDAGDDYFKSIRLENKQIVELFRGNFPDTTQVIWAPAAQSALVKLNGKHNFPGMVDNTDLLGRYVVLGERPQQGKPNYNGITTWLFDDERRTASGWTPVWLNESIRQVAFGSGGAETLYIYETADGEYSLVRALPDGQEWERVVTDMPRLDSNAVLEWGNDNQHALIKSDSRLLLVDIVAKTVNEIASDWLVGSDYAISPQGDKLAYVAKVGDQDKLVTYDFISSEVKAVDTVAVSAATKLVWVGDSQVLVAGDNQTFIKVDLDGGDITKIPFVGEEIDFQIQRMEYSQAGRLLMLVTDKGIFTMKMV